jgi:hypothetical protein
MPTSQDARQRVDSAYSDMPKIPSHSPSCCVAVQCFVSASTTYGIALSRVRHHLPWKAFNKGIGSSSITTSTSPYSLT